MLPDWWRILVPVFLTAQGLSIYFVPGRRVFQPLRPVALSRRIQSMDPNCATIR